MESHDVAEKENAEPACIINLNDEKDGWHLITGTNVTIQASQKAAIENHTAGSNRVRSDVIANQHWDRKFYSGRLVASNSDFMAYSLSGRNGYVIRVIHIQTRNRTLLKGMEGGVADLGFAHKLSDLFACIDQMGSIFIWNLELQNDVIEATVKLYIVRDEPAVGVHRLMWSPQTPATPDENSDDAADGLGIAVVFNTTVEVWDVGMASAAQVGNEPIRRHHLEHGVLVVENAHNGPISDLCLSPDGNVFATASEDGDAKFWQVDYEGGSEKKEPLHAFKPHNGQPVSRIFFTDNHVSKDVNVPFWRFLVTGCRANSELKIWCAVKWLCLQTISFASSPGYLGPIPELQVAMDLSASYLIISDINRAVLYIFRLNLDFASGIARLDGIMEFLLSQPLLSLTVNEVKEAQQGDDVLVGDTTIETEETNQVLVKLFCVHTKCMQELQLRFPVFDAAAVADSQEAESEMTATAAAIAEVTSRNETQEQLPLPLLGPDDFTSRSELTSSSSVNFVTSIPPSISSPTPSIPSEENHVTASAASSSRSTLSSTHEEKPPTSSRMEPLLTTPSSTHEEKPPTPSRMEPLLTTPSSTHEEKPPTPSRMEPFLTTPSSTHKEKPPTPSRMEPFLTTLSSTGKENPPTLSMTEPSLNQFGSLLTGIPKMPHGSSQLRLEDNEEKKESEARDSDSELDGVTETKASETAAAAPRPMFPAANRNEVEPNQFEKIFENSSAAMELETTSGSGTILGNGDVVKDGLSEDRDESVNDDEETPTFPLKDPLLQNVAAGETFHGSRNENAQVISPGLSDSDQSLLRKSGNHQEGQTDVTALLNEMVTCIKSQQADLAALSQRLAEEKRKREEVNTTFTTLITRLQDSIGESFTAQTQKMIQAQKELLDQVDAEKKQRHDSLVSSLHQAVANALQGRAEKTIKNEIKTTVVPAINKVFSPIQDQINRTLSEKLVVADRVVREGIEKLVGNQAVVEMIGRVVGIVVQQNVQVSFRDVVLSSLVPGFEKACQTMTTQINDLFFQGTRQYLEQVRQETETQAAALKSSADNVMSQVLQQATSIQGLPDVVLRSFTDSVHSVLEESCAASLAKMTDDLAEQVGRIVQEQVVPELAARPVVVSDSLGRRKDQIKGVLVEMVKQGRFKDAFQQALSAADLELVVLVCSSIAPEKLFAAEYPLPQPILLSLIQQLASDLKDHVDLKLKFIQGSVLSLDATNTVTSQHMESVLRTLSDQLRKSQPRIQAENPSLIHTLRGLSMIVQGMLR